MNSTKLRHNSGSKSIPQTTDHTIIEIPWRCWYSNTTFKLTFPMNWRVMKISMNDHAAISDEQMRKSIINPISSPRLQDIAKGKNKPIVVIDDLNRPTETFRILPLLLDEMNRAGLKNEQIDVLVSLGAHRPMSKAELVKKIGRRMINTLKVYNHNPYENLQLVGKTSWGTPLYMNKFLIESDLKIVVGSAIPHPYAGFGGGAKLLLPGLAGMDTIELNHKPAYKSTTGMIGKIEGNERRAEIEEAASIVGIDFAVTTVLNSAGRTAGVFAGNLLESYKEAVKYAQKVYATDMLYNLDAGVFNAFPKDNGIIQSFNSLNVWGSRNNEKQIVRPGGTIVIVSSCPDGSGYHGLTDRGMRLHVRRDQHGSFKDIFANRKIVFFSPNIIPRDLADFLPDAKLIRSWPKVIEELRNNHPFDLSIGVFPCSPLQIDKSIL